MKLDPNKACGNTEENFIFAWLHDAVAHPIMAISLWSKLSLKFHDYTSKKAWPAARNKFKVYKFKHPNVSHIFVTGGMSKEAARISARNWFDELGKEFGGNFVCDKFEELP